MWEKRIVMFHWGGLYPASHKTIKVGEHNGENVFYLMCLP